jgi:predicted DNA binding protein
VGAPAGLVLTRGTDRATPTGTLPTCRILTCRIRVWLERSSWLCALTKAYPELELRVRGRLDLRRGLTLFEVELAPADGHNWSEIIRALPGVVDVELLDASGDVELCRVFFRGETVASVIKRFGLIRQYPFPVRAGVATWTVVGPETKVRGLLDALRARPWPVQVESVRGGTPETNRYGLTTRQKEILRRALAEGYFDVPRRISLTELAERVGVAVSTLSVSLSVIERKIVAHHA